MWKVFFAGTAAERQRAEAVVEAATAKGAAGAARESIEITRETIREKTIIDERTVLNDRTIKQAPGADHANPGVADALNRALCLRAAYQREPDCAALRRDDRSLGAAGGDTGSTPAAE